MRVFIAVVALLVLSLGTYSFLTGYRSAFEADQACHAEKWIRYGEDSSFGCDHDLETDQWILYETASNHEPAKVVERFRY